MSIQNIMVHIKKSKLFKDSFWAVFGNGLGNALLLVAGIVIARILGKDLYGEYGVVKTTMFQVAAFSTFGLGYTSTKFIAQYVKENQECLREITKSVLTISLISSFCLCFFLIFFSQQLADFVNAPQLAIPFRFLGLIIVTRALSTVCSGLISGYKRFKSQGLFNIVSGVIMLILAPVLTFYIGLIGSLIALLFSQLVLSLLYLIFLYKLYHQLPLSNGRMFAGTIFRSSIPVAMQEFTFALAHWGSTLIMTKYSSLGEVGIYSATAQWNSVIMFIPMILSSVVLSYLSGITDKEEHNNMMYRVLAINIVCVLIPFFIVLSCSKLICSMYGPSFSGMEIVLNVLMVCTVIAVIARVFQNDLISRGKNWLLFSLRAGRDIISLICIYFVLKITSGIDGALHYAIIIVVLDFLFLLVLVAFFYFQQVKNTNSEVYRIKTTIKE